MLSNVEVRRGSRCESSQDVLFAELWINVSYLPNEDWLCFKRRKLPVLKNSKTWSEKAFYDRTRPESSSGRAVLSGFCAARHLPCLSKLGRGSVNESAFMSNNLKATNQDKCEKTGKADSCAFKCVSGAYVRPRKFLSYNETGHRFRKEWISIYKASVCSFARFITFR